MSPSLRRLTNTATFRLALGYMALFGASAVLLLSFIWWTTAGVIERQVGETVEAELRGLADQYRTEGPRGLIQAIDRRSSRGAGDPDGIYLLTDPLGRRVAGNIDTWPAGVQTDGQWTRLEVFRADVERRRLIGARAFALGGGYRLLVGRDMVALGSFQAVLLEALIWGVGVTLVLGLISGIFMSRRLLARVEAIGSTSREIMEGDLSKRIALDGSDDEFDRLAQNLNRMLERIEALMGEMRLVTDSLAHDLRSPLTRLRGGLDMALRAPSAERDRAIAQAIAQADAVLATFTALIEISRIEAGIGRSEMVPLDLADSLRDIVELYQPVAEEKGLSVTLDAVSAAPMHGSPQLLALALSNLLDNAVKYCRAGDIIALSLGAEGEGAESHWVLTIADTGPGIPVADRDRVFERFVRLDESRHAPGSGLGLSLVAAIAKLHGGTVTLEDNAPGLRLVWRLSVHSSNAALQ
ncbi:MAG: HAMP domain-containing histidine kinase [Alphaproteobacteria bacterium]|nr:HAMP domain-containing histidine kinase [Alphaproteobacteria bacterium]MBU0798197.1 HAMP domain-containing histidine kinase [Alphaproteobacteria bacterium]MBU0887585.1 HAMP domain-containing histidine kinase [Alphaproteobacteria bacterium]MBU1814236.1 HAMP domain-containing histidine kinase [Alphaproteobacteria bacterium]MBU2089623.1 HAMP domain-containing histidine kinase [Alphaproteobacteria bacterium]